MNSPKFTSDIYRLLRPNIKYDSTIAYKLIITKLLPKMLPMVDIICYINATTIKIIEGI